MPCLRWTAGMECVCCTLQAENSAISCSSARTALTQVQCAVKLGKEWGIRGLGSKQKFSNNKVQFVFIIYLSLTGKCCQGVEGFKKIRCRTRIDSVQASSNG